MNISSCLHPVKIWPHGKDYEFKMVPCGKCLACQHNKRVLWTNRLKAESKLYKYVCFLTLTYSDSMIPRALKTEDGNLYDPFTGEYFDIKTYFYEQFNKKDFASNEIKERESKETAYYNRYSRFNYARISDVSDMFKRVRTQLVRLFEKELESHDAALQAVKFRMFGCSEYGALSFRPHYHFIIWHNSELLARKVGTDSRGHEVCLFEQYIRNNWSINIGSRKFPRYRRLSNYYGVDFQYERHSIAGYVSKYVTSNTSLPILYSFPAFKTKHIQSSRPPIGFNIVSQFSDYEIFQRQITKYLVKTNDIQEPIKYVSLPSFITDRIFRKCTGFGLLSIPNRIKLYGFVPRRYIQKSFSEFREYFSKRIGLYDGYICLRERIKADPALLYVYDDNLRVNETYLKRLYSFSKSVQKHSESLGLSLYDYVVKVDEYYKKVEYENLKEQLKFEDEYVKSGKPLCDLLFMFPNYFDTVLSSGYFDNLYHGRFDVFASFGIDLDRLYKYYEIQDPNLKVTKSKIITVDNYGNDCTINPIYKNLSYYNTLEYDERRDTFLKEKHDNDKSSKRNEYDLDRNNPKFKNYRIY